MSKPIANQNIETDHTGDRDYMGPMPEEETAGEIARAIIGTVCSKPVEIVRRIRDATRDLAEQALKAAGWESK